MNKKKRNYFFITCVVIGIGLLLWIESNKNFTHLERENKSTSPVSVNEETDFSIQIPDSWKEEIDLYNKKVIKQLIEYFNKLKGIIIGTSIAITASIGAPINKGVNIKFINTIL